MYTGLQQCCRYLWSTGLVTQLTIQLVRVGQGHPISMHTNRGLEEFALAGRTSLEKTVKITEIRGKLIPVGRFGKLGPETLHTQGPGNPDMLSLAAGVGAVVITGILRRQGRMGLTRQHYKPMSQT